MTLSKVTETFKLSEHLRFSSPARGRQDMEVKIHQKPWKNCETDLIEFSIVVVVQIVFCCLICQSFLFCLYRLYCQCLYRLPCLLWPDVANCRSSKLREKHICICCDQNFSDLSPSPDATPNLQTCKSVKKKHKCIFVQTISTQNA